MILQLRKLTGHIFTFSDKDLTKSEFVMGYTSQLVELAKKDTEAATSNTKVQTLETVIEKSTTTQENLVDHENAAIATAKEHHTYSKHSLSSLRIG